MDPEIAAMIDMILNGTGGPGQNYLGAQYAAPSFNVFGGPYGLEPNTDEGLPDYNANATAASKIRSGYADMVTAALSGPGAFGPQQFQPQVEYTDITDQTPWNNAQAYLGGGGIEGLTARKAMEGSLPTEITGYVKLLRSLEPGTDEYESAKANYTTGGGDPAEFDQDWSSIQSSVPEYTSDLGESELDQSALQSTVQEVWGQIRQADQYFNNMYDPETNPTGLYEDQGGVLRQREVVPTESMEWFDDKGLSYPDQQYDYDYFLQNSPELQAVEGRLSTADEDLAAMARQLYQTRRTRTTPLGEGGEGAGPTPTPTTPDYVAPTPSSKVNPRAPEQWGGGRNPDMPYQAGTSSAILDRLAAEGNASQLDAAGLTEQELNSARAEGIRGGLYDDFFGELSETIRNGGQSRPDPSAPIPSRGNIETGNPNAAWRGPRKLVNYTGWDDPQRRRDMSNYVGGVRQKFSDSDDAFAARGRALNLQNAGRTPLGDQMQQRAMQMFMSGMVPGF